MPGLVLEGGTFRPIFSAGVMDALLDEDIMFPYVIGVSAGITNGTSYISRQPGRNLRILMSHRKDSRYIGMKNLLKEAKIRLAAKRPIMIFPEGTRTHPGTTNVYKPGIAFLYQNIKTEVVPVAVNTGLFWRKKSFLRHPGKVIIEFMKPLPHGLEKREFINTLQDTIEKKCAELNLETIKNYPETKSMIAQPKGK